MKSRQVCPFIQQNVDQNFFFYDHELHSHAISLRSNLATKYVTVQLNSITAQLLLSHARFSCNVSKSLLRFFRCIPLPFNDKFLLQCEAGSIDDRSQGVFSASGCHLETVKERCKVARSTLIFTYKFYLQHDFLKKPAKTKIVIP